MGFLRCGDTNGFIRDGLFRLGALVALLRRVGIAPFLLLAFVLAPLTQEGGASSIAGLPPLCPLRNLAGLPCPICGVTRSLVCCGHGRWAEAAAYHPLGPLAFTLLVLWTASRLLPDRLRLASKDAPWLLPAASWTAVALLLGVWGARLAGVLPAPP